MWPGTGSGTGLHPGGGLPQTWYLCGFRQGIGGTWVPCGFKPGLGGTWVLFGFRLGGFWWQLQVLLLHLLGQDGLDETRGHLSSALVQREGLMESPRGLDL